MLTLFPLMFLSLLAHAILRIAAGGMVCILGIRHLTGGRGVPRALLFFGLAECVVGGMVLVGFLTQVGALGLILISVSALLMRKSLGAFLPSPSFYVLLLAAALSLFITGAGAFAIDLPF